MPARQGKIEGPSKILVVDDEPAILHILKRNLGRYGYTVTTAADGEEALARLGETLPDLLLLDLMLPRLTGLEVCRQVREWSQLPIIILSARGEEDQKVEALDLGADDYLTKPFGMKELLARVRVNLRRSSPPTEARKEGAVFHYEDLTIDFERRMVRVAGQEIRLTRKEYELLKYLTQNAGQILTHQVALSHIWGPECENETHYLHVLVARLRQKIETDPSQPRYILAESGVGYRFKALF